MLTQSNRTFKQLQSQSPIMRRSFIAGLVGGASAIAFGQDVYQGRTGAISRGVEVPTSGLSEDLFAYMQRCHQGFDTTVYRQLLGASNEHKEGDESLGLSAADVESRENARAQLSQTRIGKLQAHTVFEDDLSKYLRSAIDVERAEELADWSMAELRRFLLDASEGQIKRIMPGLDSDVIACVTKLMSNEQLIQVGAKLFNPLPGSQVGAQGYLGARVQPNSPTDHTDDIQWQVFNSFAFAVGDVLLGSNPVSSEVESVAAVELALAEVLETFNLTDVLPHCVLAHIDIQADVENAYAGSTALWFQSLAGVEDANETFDINVAKMVRHAATRTGKFGLYFETGQGADATNRHGKGFDMVIHEARKYGFARALTREVALAQERAGQTRAPWVHVNDVAGFIGPEIFRTREQLVRCCLEDIVMGKLHGLTIGLDVCSTLHMEVDLDDLDWCIDQIMPACPAYLMALPTKNDPMLSYLTTAFQDHVRIREKFGYRVSDQMWQFFQSLGVTDVSGRPTKHFGQPAWVYLQYQRRKKDLRSDTEILAEARQKIREVQDRGVFIAEGFGDQPWNPEPELDRRVRHLYADSKKCIWAELPDGFASDLPSAVTVQSQSKDRQNYILHPPTGEMLDNASEVKIERLRDKHAGLYDVQIVISDGLDAFAITDEGHLAPYLMKVRDALAEYGYHASPEHIVAREGRVRLGYRIGEILYGALPKDESHRAILHVIGERPGSGHHAFSVYITAPRVSTWSQAGLVDHNITKVVSGIADTARLPARGAEDTIRIVRQLAPLQG